MQKKWYFVLAIVIILLLDTVCILFLLDKYATQEAFNLFEAFFQYAMPKRSPFTEGSGAYFFEIQGKDPPSDFMVRFVNHSPPIKKGSDFVANDFDNNPGILFRIGSWKWIGLGWLTRDHAEIYCEYEIRDVVYPATYIFKRDRKGWAFDNMGPVSPHYHK